MKTTDSDLIDKLNTLPDKDRADLLEFLGRPITTKAERLNLEERLEASVELHRHLDSDTKH